MCVMCVMWYTRVCVVWHVLYVMCGVLCLVCVVYICEVCVVWYVWGVSCVGCGG